MKEVQDNYVSGGIYFSLENISFLFLFVVLILRPYLIVMPFISLREHFFLQIGLVGLLHQGIMCFIEEGSRNCDIHNKRYLLMNNDIWLHFEKPVFKLFFSFFYLERGFLSVAYFTVANLVRFGISVHC